MDLIIEGLKKSDIPNSAEKIKYDNYLAFQNATNSGHPVYVKIGNTVDTVYLGTKGYGRVLFRGEWGDRGEVFDRISKEVRLNNGDIFVDWKESNVYADALSGKIVKL